MLDPKQVVFEKVKGTGVEYLANKLIEDIGIPGLEYQKTVEQKVYNWIDCASAHYSSTDINRAFALLRQYNNTYIDMVTDGTLHAIKRIDPHIDLKKTENFENFQFKKYHKSVLSGVKPKVATTLQPSFDALKDLLAKLNQKNDPRRMRRLKRKETKRRKKGVRLFDSQDDE